MNGEEREVGLISASLLASVDFNKKIPEQFRRGMSKLTDSDSEKENYDNFEPPKKCQKLNSPLLKREAALFGDGISGRNGEYVFLRDLSPKIWQRTRSGQF